MKARCQDRSFFSQGVRTAVLISVLYAASSPAQTSLAPFPEPDKTITGQGLFNTVTLGPQNTITVREAPADMQLEAFDFSIDERLLYLEWRSGRLEARDIETGNRRTDRKVTSGPLWEVHEDGPGKRLVAITENRTILFVDSKSGKIVRQIHTEKGKFNYDIHRVLLAADGSWLAYVTEDSGGVIDLRSEPPRTLADLRDGDAIQLSPDARSLWVLNRNMFFGFNVSDWASLGEVKLMDQVAGTVQPSLAVLQGETGPIAFVPSQSGLLRYDLSKLAGRKVTNTPVYWVGGDQTHNQVFVREFEASAMYGASGAVECRWQLRPAQDFKMSPSGKWLGYRNFGKAELWSTDKLTQACSSSEE